MKVGDAPPRAPLMRKWSCLAYKRVLIVLVTALQVSSMHSWNTADHLSIRRRSLFEKCSAMFFGNFLGVVQFQVLAIDEATAEAPSSTREETRVYRLLSGVALREVRVGAGPPITKSSGTILLHLRALTRDGSVLFDTRLDQNGSPMLYKVGTSLDFDYFGGDSSKRPKVTQGVEDAILSRGTATWEGSEGRQTIEPMREGGVRIAIVPSPLAYGHAGVSRYDAFRMGLRGPVPRDESLRYEIELLRCLSVPIEMQPPPAADGTIPAPISTTVEACCPEENYPCKTPTQQ